LVNNYTGYKKDSIYGFAEQALLIQSLRQIVNSCVVIKQQLSLVKVGDFSDKKGMGDPLRGGAYNLQSISATLEKRVCEDENMLISSFCELYTRNKKKMENFKFRKSPSTLYNAS